VLSRTLASRSASQERLYQERDKQESANFADELVGHSLLGEAVLGTEGEYRAYQQINPTITLDEVNAAFGGLFAASSPVIIANAPSGAAVPVPPADQLLAAYHAVTGRTIEPYRDSVVSNQLLATVPEPVAITAERTIPELGITEWTLANGVRVVLKPTDYKNDEVVLRATSPGGISLYPDSVIASAMFAATVAELGGLGALSAVDLRKALSGKVASASASIGERTEGISGQSNASDVETMLQLVYLRFTAPRTDSSAFLAYKQSMQTALANMAANPQQAFSDTLTAVLSQHSPRVRPFSAALFDEINFDRAVAIYRDRFADASDFTFFLVGSFTLDSIRPLVQRYLGGLPSIDREEVARDVGPTPPTGVIERVVRKGSEPQSQTVMVFSQPFTWDSRENHLLSSLGTILGNRLLDNLRERLGGTYGASAQVQGNRDYPHVTLGMVQFGSAPDRVEELEAAVLAEIRALADSGPSPAELDKVREAQIRARETAVRTNQFWAGRLSQAWQYGDDPTDILRFRELVDGLTAERVRDAARRYLSGDNYVRVTLLPAEVTP
jgi:zinc protease